MTAQQQEMIMQAIGKMTPELQRGIAIGIAAALEVNHPQEPPKRDAAPEGSARTE